MFLHELLFDELGFHRTDEDGNRRFPQEVVHFWDGSPKGVANHWLSFDLEEVNKVDQCAFYNLEDYKVEKVDVTKVTAKNPTAVTIWLRPLTPVELEDQKRGYTLSHTSL